MPNSSTTNRRQVLKLTGAAAAAGVASLAGCTGAPTEGGDTNSSGQSGNVNDQVSLAYAGGAEGTAGFAMASGWAQLLREETSSQVTMSPQTTGGTVTNVRFVANRDHDLGWSGGPQIIQGTQGLDPFNQEHDINLMLTTSVYPLPFALTLDGNGIDYLEDLIGSNMAAAPPGASSMQDLIAYLKANDLWEGENSINQRKVAYPEGARLLENGQVDASVGYALNNSPPPWMNEFITRNDDAKLVFPKDAETRVEAYREDRIGTIRWNLKAENFAHAWENSVAAGASEQLVGAGTQTQIIHPDVPEDTVYRMVKILVDNKDALPEYHSLWSGFASDPAQFTTALSIKSAPFHPGAAKALEEAGYWDDSAAVAE